MDRYLAIMAGAALGGLLRYLASSAINERLSSDVSFWSRFPWGTFFVNVTGCFLIGLAMTILMERVAVHRNWSMFLVTGMLGGYTTFSTFGWETFQASRLSSHWLALANVVLSAVFGYLAVWCGVVLARR